MDVVGQHHEAGVIGTMRPVGGLHLDELDVVVGDQPELGDLAPDEAVVEALAQLGHAPRPGS